MPLISVVIPVHGVEDYLDRCLDSVLGPVGEADSGQTASGQADQADQADHAWPTALLASVLWWVAFTLALRSF